MAKRIPLDRLCQISKQRNVRRPPLLNDEKGQVEGAGLSRHGHVDGDVALSVENRAKPQSVAVSETRRS
jgi:hypothetical protein